MRFWKRDFGECDYRLYQQSWRQLSGKYARIMDESLEKFVARVEGVLKENGHDTEFINIIYVGGGAKAMERFGNMGITFHM